MPTNEELLQKVNELEKEDTSLVQLDDNIVDDKLPVDYFRYLKLPVRNTTNTQITEVQLKRLKDHVRGLRTGTHAAVPLVCAGSSGCPFLEFCPLTEYDDQGEIDEQKSAWPKYSQCPVEANVLTGKIIDLAREYDVNPEMATDLAIISKIAEIDVYDHRLSMILAKDDNQGLLLEEITTVNQKSGDAYSTLKEHPALIIKDRLAKQRERLVREMLGTRRERAKIDKDKNDKDSYANKASELIAAVKTAQKESENEIEVEVVG